MHLRIAISVTFVVMAFIVAAALGGKLSYEVGMTGLLGVLTYWAMPPRVGADAQIDRGSDVDSSN